MHPACLLLLLPLLPALDRLVGAFGGWLFVALVAGMLHITLAALRLLVSDLTR